MYVIDCIDMTKVSIIIPVYNSALFLEACVQSLIQQTFADYEIWLIDDGSTDASGHMCDVFSQQDSRIQVVHTMNRGAAHARQVGVAKATGEYLLFVDSDDTMPSDGLSRMYEVARKYPASDIIVGFCRPSLSWGKSELSPRQYRNLLIEGRFNISTLWGKLFRRSLFSQGIPTLPSHLVMGEDMLINIYLAFRTQQPIRLVRGKEIYNYIQRDGGISRQFVLTASYESDFHLERLRMIPMSERADYMPVLIHRRLRMLRRLVRRAKELQILEQLEYNPFVLELERDITDYHYSFWRYPRPSVWKLLDKKDLFAPSLLIRRMI